MASTYVTAGGLKHEAIGGCDYYTGSAQDIIAAGLVTADQFPGQPGRGKTMCTYYAGALVQKGARHAWDEHYTSIRRCAGGNFEVKRGVPEHVYQERVAARRAATEQREAEERAEQRRALSKEKTAEDYREFCLRGVDFSWRLDGGEGLYDEFRFSDDVRQRIESLAAEIRKVIEQGAVLPLRPKADRGRRHLRLAWSAS